MKAANNNSFRILGLLANVTTRGWKKQTQRLKKCIKSGQGPPQDDCSFSAPDKLPQNMDTVLEATRPIWGTLITKTKEDGRQFWKPVTEENYLAGNNNECIARQRIEESIEGLRAYPYQDYYRAIALLRSIKEVYVQLDQENMHLSDQNRWVVNKTKVLDFFKQEIPDATVCKLAASNNQDLIIEFYELLKYLQNKMLNEPLLYHLENVLCDNLSDTPALKTILFSIVKERKKKRNHA